MRTTCRLVAILLWALLGGPALAEKVDATKAAPPGALVQLQYFDRPLRTFEAVALARAAKAKRP